MVFRKLLLLILCMIFPGAGCAAESCLLSAAAVSADLIRAYASPGRAELTLKLANHTDALRRIILFAPAADGQSASFNTRDASLNLELEPAAEEEIRILISSDMQDKVPQTASFRFCFQETITTPAEIRLENGAAQSAQFIPQSEWILAPDVQTAGALPSQSLILLDSVPFTVTAMLESAAVRVCLMPEEEGDRLVQLMTLQADVDRTGNARAEYSGLVLLLNGDSRFILSAEEKTDGSGTLWSAGRMTLYSDDIYFAVLNAEIALREGRILVEKQTVQSEETGTAGPAPFSLFDEGTVSSLTYRLTEKDGAVVPMPDSAVSAPLHCSEQFRVRAVPASSLGKIVCFFEYELLDGSRIVHEAVPVY